MNTIDWSITCKAVQSGLLVYTFTQMGDQTGSSLSKVRLLLWKSSCRYFSSNPQSTGKGILSFVITGSSTPSSAAEVDHGCPWRFILSSQKANSYQIHPRSLTPVYSKIIYGHCAVTSQNSVLQSSA